MLKCAYVILYKYIYIYIYIESTHRVNISSLRTQGMFK